AIAAQKAATNEQHYLDVLKSGHGGSASGYYNDKGQFQGQVFAGDAMRSAQQAFGAQGLGDIARFFATIPGVGAVAGQAAGVVGTLIDSLLGAGQAAERFRQAVAQYQQSMLEWEHQLSGHNTSLQQAEDAARARAAQQRATLRDLYGGNPGRVPEYIREM